MNLKVIKSTQSSKGGFVTTVEASKTVMCPFTGEPIEAKRRLLIKTPAAAPVGKEVSLDLSGYQQREYRSTVTNDDGEQREISNSWLHVKVEA